MRPWMIAALIVLLAVESFGIGILIEKRLVSWFLQRGRREAWPVARSVVLVHLAWFTAWVAVGLAAHRVSDAAGSRAAAGWVVVPMIAAYGPFVVPFLPQPYSGYSSARAAVRRTGASNAVSRALYWTAGPLSVIGMLTCFAAFAACFDA